MTTILIFLIQKLFQIAGFGRISLCSFVNPYEAFTVVCALKSYFSPHRLVIVRFTSVPVSTES